MPPAVRMLPHSDAADMRDQVFYTQPVVPVQKANGTGVHPQRYHQAARGSLAAMRPVAPVQMGNGNRYHHAQSTATVESVLVEPLPGALVVTPLAGAPGMPAFTTAPVVAEVD